LAVQPGPIGGKPGFPVPPGVLAAKPAPSAKPTVPVYRPVTADQLREIMPDARQHADDYVDALNTAMRRNNITTAPQQAAFLAHIAVESKQLHSLAEGLNYSAARAMKIFHHSIRTKKAALRYAHHPEALANHVYANRNGNGDEASGDGYRFRGGGFMQTTGRSNYAAVGYEDDPDALRTPEAAAATAAQFWVSKKLNPDTAAELDRAHFDNTTKKVNGSLTGGKERWEAYQRALTAFKNADAAVGK
jgi:putative chitinase